MSSKFNYYFSLLNQQRTYDDYVDEIPFEPVFTPEKKIYFISRTSVRSIRDITYDCYSPWSGKSYDGKGKKTTKIQSCGAMFDGINWFAAPEMEDKIKIYRNQHPKYSCVIREYFYILSSESILLTDVVVTYSSTIEIEYLDSPHNSMLPSTRGVISEVLENRNTQEAKKVLRDKGLRITTKQLNSIGRNVESYCKTLSGSRAPSNFHKLKDRYLLSPNKEEDVCDPVIKKEGENITVCQVVLYPEAIRQFSSALPYVEDLEYHKHNLKIFENLEGEEAQKEYATYLSFCTTSGSIPNLGSSVLIDTTFSLCSGEYTTLAIGTSDQLRNGISQKNSTILLGVMIHSTKMKENHERFSRELNRVFENEKNKVVPAVIHDGEAAFSYYTTGSFFEKSVSLRCDVHILKNIKDIVKNQKNLEGIKKGLFGYKLQRNGAIILQPGVFSSLSSSTFRRRLYDFLLSLPPEEEKLHTWLLNNETMLFNSVSLIKKLEGGWCVQFLTTNSIENKNNRLKKLIPIPLKAHKVLDCLLTLHREEIEDRFNAVVGKPSPLICLTSSDERSWNLLPRQEQEERLSSFGMHTHMVDCRLKGLPAWIYDNVDGLTPDNIKKVLDTYEVHTSRNDPQTFFCFSKKESLSIFLVNVIDGTMICHIQECKQDHRKNLRFCLHALAVLSSLTRDEQRVVCRKLDFKRRRRNSTQYKFIAQKNTDGGKYNRIGRNYSKNNNDRTFNALNSSATTTVSLNESSLNEEVEIPIDFE